MNGSQKFLWGALFFYCIRFPNNVFAQSADIESHMQSVGESQNIVTVNKLTSSKMDSVSIQLDNEKLLVLEIENLKREIELLKQNQKKKSVEGKRIKVGGKVETRLYYHLTEQFKQQADLGRGLYFRHRRASVYVQGKVTDDVYGKIDFLLQPNPAKGKKVINGDKRYFGTHLMVDMDEAFVHVSRLPVIPIQSQFRMGRQQIKFGLNPDKTLVLDDYDFTSDDHFYSIHNALRFWVSSSHIHSTVFYSRTVQGLDGKGGDPIPEGSKSLMGVQITTDFIPWFEFGGYHLFDHFNSSVRNNKFYSAFIFAGSNAWLEYFGEFTRMQRERIDGGIDTAWGWYFGGNYRKKIARLGHFNFYLEHAALQSDDPSTLEVNETFESDYNHLRFGESLDHRKTKGKSLYWLRFGYNPNFCEDLELGLGYLYQQEFNRHFLFKNKYPPDIYDETGTEMQLRSIYKLSNILEFRCFLVWYFPHQELRADGRTRNPKEFLIQSGIKVAF